MIKYAHIPGVDSIGNVLVEALRFEQGMVKTASIKTALLHKDLKTYIDKLKPAEGKLYVLVHALGAGEYWGANINGDWFPEEQLKDPSGKNGYKTFYDAGVYRHHVNKDKKKSMGDVVVSVWNDVMKRVELLLCIDRKKAQEFGHQDLIEELDRGGHPAVSMGMRTPYDLCSICGHKSKTISDYCKHLQPGARGKVFPDGRKAYMINPVFKAFDISFVLIGADQTSFAIAKVASMNKISSDFKRAALTLGVAGAGVAGLKALQSRRKKNKRPSKPAPRRISASERALYAREQSAMGNPRRLDGESSEAYAERMRRFGKHHKKGRDADAVVHSYNIQPDKADGKFHSYNAPGDTDVTDIPYRITWNKKKVASIDKQAIYDKMAARKLAEIIKRTPLADIHDREEMLPPHLLDRLGGVPLKSALATTGSLGIMLKPREFQRITLIMIGKKPMADSLDRCGQVFTPCSCSDRSLSFGGGDVLSKLLPALLPMIAGRSFFDPALSRRSKKTKTAAAVQQDQHVSDPTLDAISELYNGYVDNLADSVEDLIKISMAHGEVREAFYPDLVEDAFYGFEKTAGPSEKLMIFGVLPAMYLLSKMLRRAEGDPNTEGQFSYLVKKHPVVTASVVKGLINMAT